MSQLIEKRGKWCLREGNKLRKFNTKQEALEYLGMLPEPAPEPEEAQLEFNYAQDQY